MGACFAHSIANLFMGMFDTKMQKNYELKLIVWLRFDIFMIWTHGENLLNKFVQYINSTDRTIKPWHSWTKNSNRLR